MLASLPTNHFYSNSNVVLDAGKIVEMGNPLSLLADTSSLFYSMDENAGITTN
jgi:ABC-type multidrug transport system fused ATPase/permease subunit